MGASFASAFYCASIFSAARRRRPATTSNRSGPASRTCKILQQAVGLEAGGESRDANPDAGFPHIGRGGKQLVEGDHLHIHDGHSCLRWLRGAAAAAPLPVSETGVASGGRLLGRPRNATKLTPSAVSSAVSWRKPVAAREGSALSHRAVSAAACASREGSSPGRAETPRRQLHQSGGFGRLRLEPGLQHTVKPLQFCCRNG
jgi:hypothetical protein